MKPIQIDNLQQRHPFPWDLRRKMTEVLSECMAMAENPPAPLMVQVSLVSPRAMQKLNRERRGVNAVTDVLSFPVIEWENAAPARFDSLHEQVWRCPETGHVLLGDIVLCPDRAVQQALQYGHSYERELCFLAAHGLLHLLGYDHQNKAQEAQMSELAQKILTNAQLPRG